MRARFRAVVLLLAWPALTAQTTGKLPAPALQTQVQKAEVNISVDPETPTVNKPAELRAKVTGVAGILRYVFNVDGARQTQCSSESPVCAWTPTASGEHIAHVVVNRQPPAGGGRASGGQVGEARILVKVQPPRTPTFPAQTKKPLAANAGVSISVDPETPTVDKPAELRAKVTEITGTLLYEFDVDGIRQTDCSPKLSVCTWTPTASGEHLAHVVVTARPTAVSGRASGGSRYEARIPVKVQPPKKPTFPVQTPKSPVQNADVSISVDPETPTVDKPAELRAKVTEITGTLLYEFDVDGIRQTDCSPKLSVCTWTPTASGEHLAHVVVTARPTAVSGRASGGSRYEARIPVKVQPPKKPTFPVQTPKSPVQNADVSISVDPVEPTVNKPADLRAKVSGVAGPLRYVFDVDGARQTQCFSESSVCTWTPTTTGEHIAHVIVSGPTAGGRRGSEEFRYEARIGAKVQPEKTPTPTRTPTFTPPPTPTPALTPAFTPPPKPTPALTPTFTPTPTPTPALTPTFTPTPTPALIPTSTPTPAPTPALTPTSTPADAPLDNGPDKLASPEIAVKMLSSKAVAGEPARFVVSLVNAKPFAYAIDMDGKDFETRTDAEFDHTFQRPGDVTIVARFPATGRARVEARLRVTVEAPQTDRTWLLYVVVGTPLLFFAFFAGRIIRRLFLPTATFLAVPDLKPRFDPSRSGGIALEVVYVPNVASLRYSPRVPIDPEP